MVKIDDSKIFLKIPFPPSVNTYWGFHGHRRFLTEKAVKFKQAVAHEVSQQKQNFGKERLAITIYLHAPDKRVRDVDNIAKPTLDALVQSGLFEDDSQVDSLTIRRCETMKGGSACLEIEKIKKIFWCSPFSQESGLYNSSAFLGKENQCTTSS